MRTPMLFIVPALVVMAFASGGCGLANAAAALGNDPLTNNGDTTEGAPCGTALCDCEGVGCTCNASDATCTCDGDCSIRVRNGGPSCDGPCVCDVQSCDCIDGECTAAGAGQTCTGATCSCGNGGCEN